MPTDEEKLDDAKKRYLDAKEEIELLREKIALANCPLKIGDRITIIDGSKSNEGIIESVYAVTSRSEFMSPIVGATTGWGVDCGRINKTTGKVGKRRIGINSFDARQVDGNWEVIPRSLEDYLLSPDVIGC
ncbi:MAG: hypothetical protein JKY80_09395 [Mariprofundaceae bacterium]|nr:hypothetical protein [Mariprofundaceae bacterium]